MSLPIENFEDDLLGGELIKFANRLIAFIDVERHFVEGGLVVTISSPYGSGKSTFFRMLRNQLLKGGKPAEEMLVVPLNAWESDYYGDPLFAIVSALIDQLPKDPAIEITSIAKSLGWGGTFTALQVLKKTTGVDPFETAKAVKKKSTKREDIPDIEDDLFSLFRFRKETMDRLKNSIESFIKTYEKRIIFLVDELDRCRPDYAISYLETIKHIFAVPGTIFILAADRKHLENSARAAFGRDLDFDEYYRKFIHRESSLPAITDVGYKVLAKSYVSHYLTRNGLRRPLLDLSAHRIDLIIELISGFKLRPRQIQEVFRLLGHAFGVKEEHPAQNVKAWDVEITAIALATIKVGAPGFYHRIANADLEPKEAWAFLNSIKTEQLMDPWFRLLASGGGLKVPPGSTFNDLCNSVGIETDPDSMSFVVTKGRIRVVYSMLESISSYAQP